MSRLHIATLAFGTVLLAAPAIASAQSRGVALGAGAGLSIPDGDLDFKLGYNWGFFVDIPLISTFHITPSTTVYRLEPKGAMAAGAFNTDVSLNFKFVVPLGLLEPYGAVIAGLTATNEIYPHVGLAAGANINLLANLGVFVQVNYKLVLYGDPAGNVKDLEVYAGPLFKFY